jgi:hypothetical protein
MLIIGIKADFDFTIVTLLCLVLHAQTDAQKGFQFLPFREFRRSI